jgi:hypothetical protein
MAFWGDTEPEAWRTLYLYLRTRLALDYSHDAIGTFRGAFGRRSQMLWLDNDMTWDNGIVLRVTALKSAIDLADEIGGALNQFEAWAVIDDTGKYIESQTNGPMSRFFENMPTHGDRIDYSQIFMMWNEENQWYRDIIDKIRNSMRGYHAPVFFFTDGQILFLDSQESGKVTNRRCNRHLRSLDGWCIVDSLNETLSRDGPDRELWAITDLDALLGNE